MEEEGANKKVIITPEPSTEFFPIKFISKFKINKMIEKTKLNKGEAELHFNEKGGNMWPLEHNQLAYCAMRLKTSSM